jgi:chromosomal replication initiation ATPase DnaA
MIQHAPLPTHAPVALWQVALVELRRQMTKATFNAWLADSCVLTTASTPIFWVIVVSNEYAWEWLTYRLCPVIERTVVGLVEKPVTVCFVPRAMRRKCHESPRRSPSRICFD